MKRAGNLIAEIASWENLLLAYSRARKGKSHRKEVQRYSANLNRELSHLQQQFIQGRVEVGEYHFFKIYDPKERMICAASFPERVMQHALMNVCGSVFERQQVYESFATRKNKGTLAAIRLAHQCSKEYPYYLKMDIRKYFDSISHPILKDQLRRKFKDQRVLSVFDQIIDSYALNTDRGLPIGNLSSQYFANYYLSFFDRFVKQEIKAPAYIRYMDDMLVWHKDKDHLLSLRKRFTEFLSQRLELTCKHMYCNTSDHGVPFLGFRLYPGTIRLNSRSRNRFTKKLKSYTREWESGDMSEREYADRMRSVIAFTRFGHSQSFRKATLQKQGVFLLN